MRDNDILKIGHFHELVSWPPLLKCNRNMKKRFCYFHVAHVSEIVAHTVEAAWPNAQLWLLLSSLKLTAFKQWHKVPAREGACNLAWCKSHTIRGTQACGQVFWQWSPLVGDFLLLLPSWPGGHGWPQCGPGQKPPRHMQVDGRLNLPISGPWSLGEPPTLDPRCPWGRGLDVHPKWPRMVFSRVLSQSSCEMDAWVRIALWEDPAKTFLPTDCCFLHFHWHKTSLSC